MIVKVIIALVAFAALLHATQSTALHQNSKAIDVSAKLGLIDTIKNAIATLLQTVSVLVQDATNQIAILLDQVQDLVNLLVETVLAAVQALIDAVIAQIQDTVNTTPEILQECVLESGLLDIAGELVEDVKNCTAAQIGDVEDQVNDIKDALNQVIQTVKNLSKKLTDCGLLNIPCLLSVFTEVTADAVQLPAQIAALLAQATGLITPLLEAVKGCADGILATAEGLIEEKVPGILECIQNHVP